MLDNILRIWESITINIKDIVMEKIVVIIIGLGVLWSCLYSMAFIGGLI
jgi:hypothetical protein